MCQVMSMTAVLQNVNSEIYNGIIHAKIFEIYLNCLYCKLIKLEIYIKRNFFHNLNITNNVRVTFKLS